VQYSRLELEEIKFTNSSTILESLLIQWGYQLVDAVYSSERRDELEVVHEIISSFQAVVEHYSEYIKSFRGDVGVSLLEACQFRLDSIAGYSNSQEWLYCLADEIATLNGLFCSNAIRELKRSKKGAAADIARYRAQTAIDMKRPKVETEYLEENLAYLEAQILQ